MSPSECAVSRGVGDARRSFCGAADFWMISAGPMDAVAAVFFGADAGACDEAAWACDDQEEACSAKENAAEANLDGASVSNGRSD